MARRLKHKGVFQRGSAWWVRYVDTDGKRKSRSIGTFEDAVNYYDENKVRIRRRIHAPELTHKGIRYSQLVDDALKYSETAHRDHRMFKQRIEVSRAKFGHRLASTIAPAEIRKWLNEHGWAPGTQNRMRAAMSKAYKLGMEAQKVAANPAKLVSQNPEPPGRVRFLSDDEEAAIRKALVSRPNCIPQLDIALMTGMRKGEQFTTTWPQADLSLQHIHLDRTKNGSSRYVHLNSTAVQVLAELKEQHKRLGLPEDATLFLSGRNVPIADPREWFANACEEAKVTGVTWHTLRHTFASRLVMAGVSLKTVQELMGHKTIAMTARYSHLSPEHKMAALEKLTQR